MIMPWVWPHMAVLNAFLISVTVHTGGHYCHFHHHLPSPRSLPPAAVPPQGDRSTARNLGKDEEESEDLEEEDPVHDLRPQGQGGGT